MPRKQGLISLDRLHCFREGDTGSAEPYMFTAFFKLDGETIAIDVKDGDFFLNGPCTFVATFGGHGNLGTRDVSAGDDIAIPPVLGRTEFSLKPIRTVAGLLSGLPPVEIGGSLGVVVALLEENGFSDDAAAAGGVAFARVVEKGINDIIPTLRQGVKEAPTKEDIENLRDQVTAAIKSAVIDSQGFLRNFFSLVFHRDKAIGADAFFGSSGLEVRHRFQLLVPKFGSPLPVVEKDYELFGQIVVVDQPLQVVGVTNDGALWHTIRRQDGTWFGFGDVKGQAGDRGRFVSVGCAGTNGGLHVCGTTRDGAVWHTIRSSGGGWLGFGDVKSQAADRGVFTSVACAGLAEELHVCGTVEDGNLWHAIRRDNGTWVGFGDVRSQAGNRGAVRAVGAAVVNGGLHLCAITADGTLWHTIRHDTAKWEGFGDVKSQTGDRGRFVSVGCASVADELHVCGVTEDGKVWHTIRHLNGSWEGFGDVESQAQDRGRFTSVNCTDVNGELHVCGTTEDGSVWHTIRHEDGSWEGFGDVEGQSGDRGRFLALGLAGVI
jgi:hypothetical protein